MKSFSFREFLAHLEADGELRRITAEVDPLLEIAAITDRVCKGTENSGLLFESVKGCHFRVATNLFGSEKRLSLSLRVEHLSDLTKRFDDMLSVLSGGSAEEKLQQLHTSFLWQNAKPENSDPPSDLLPSEITLTSLPALKNNPDDGSPANDGRFLTLPVVITCDPDGSTINCGMYRAAITSDDTLAIKWNDASGAALHEALWEKTDKAMPVVIALGTSPALTLAATLPLPHTLDELTFTGLLQGERVKIFKCSNGLPAPRDAEVIIEGYLLPEPSESGVFGNHSGFYSPSARAAAVRVTTIRHRSDLILPFTIVGRPPMEDCWLARAGGCLLLSLLKVDLPRTMALYQPFAGIFHGAAIISIKKDFVENVDPVAEIRKSPWFNGAKLIVVVDEDQDPADESGVLWKIMNCVKPEKDIVISAGTVSIDATRKVGAPAAVKVDAGIAALVEKRWKEYGFDK